MSEELFGQEEEWEHSLFRIWAAREVYMDPLLLCDRADQDHDELRDTPDQ